MPQANLPRYTINLLLVLFITLIFQSTSAQDQLAFPSAMGAGAYASGGRGGEVIHVTNLNDSGIGSLRWALTDASNVLSSRTIVFDVSGIIVLNNDIRLSNIDDDGEPPVGIDPNANGITIAGQTAPEGGITITGGKIFIVAIDDVVVRYIKFRSTTNVDGCLQSQGGDNIIFDHLSGSHVESAEVTFSMVSNNEAEEGFTTGKTIQNCLVSNSGLGFIIGDTTPPNNTHNEEYTIINNLFVNVGHRAPGKIGGPVRLDIINNTVHNWVTRLIRLDDWDYTLNHIGNYYTKGGRGTQLANTAYFGTNNGLIYENDNYLDTSYVGHIWTDFDQPRVDQLPASSFVNSPFTYNNESTLNILPNINLKAEVLPYVGAYKYIDDNGNVVENRDTIDSIAINQAVTEDLTQTSEVVSYDITIADIPTTNNIRTTDFYQSNSHIPEAYLVSRGITGNENIHNQIQLSGYTLLEEYINQVDEPVTEEIPVSDVEIVTPENFSGLNVATTVDLDINFNPSDATNQSGTWSTSNIGIANVDQNGVVTGIGSGNVTITFTSAENGSVSDSIDIEVFFLISAGEDEEICSGQSTTISASGGFTFTWNTGEIDPTINVSPTLTTTYTVTATDGNGNTATDEVTIFVIESPTIYAGEDVYVMIGNSITLTADGGNSYVWSTNDTTTSINVSPTVTTLYSVLGTSENGCNNSDEVLVTVVEELNADAGDDVTICVGESVTLNASGGVNFNWDTGDTGASPTFSPTETTTYTVIVDDGFGNSDFDDVTITVNPLPVAYAGEDQTICNGESIILTAEGGDSYLWSSGETSASISVNPNVDTIYTVEVFSNNDCSQIDDVNVFVAMPPYITVSNDVVLVEGGSTSLSANGSDNYLWSTGETAAFITVSPTVTTIYSVSSIGSNGCEITENITVTVIPEVIANAGTDTVICAGESVTLNASGGANYLWDTGDVTAELIVSPTVTTTYTVVVGDDYGYTDTDTVTITVSETPDISVSNDVAVLGGATVTLTASGGNNYQWNTGETTASIDVAPTATTTYTVISTALGGCADIEQVTVTIIPEVIADAGSDATICYGESTTLNATGGGTYLWDIGNTAAELFVSPVVTTTYTVTVTDDYGYTDTDSVTITVNEAPNVTVSNNITIIEGESTTLEANGASTYLWNTGETFDSIIVSPTQTTTYTVTGTLNTCYDQAQVVVTVEPLLEVTAGDDEYICQNDNYDVVLTATQGDSYLWNTGEITQSITVSPVSTSTYSVTVTLGNQEDTDEVTVYVNPNPNVVILNGDVIDIMDGDFVTLSATGANTYEWNNGATQPNIAVSPSVTTTYEVRGYIGDCYDEKQVTINVIPEVEANAGEDIEICIDEIAILTATGGDEYVWSNGETTQIIEVSPNVTTEYTVTVFNSIDFDEDSVIVFIDNNCEEEGPINLNPDDFDFTVSPNPALDYVNVKLSGSVAVSRIYMYDIIGKLIHSDIISNTDLSISTTKRIDISNLHPGIYYIKLVDINQEISKKLLIK